MSRQDDEHPMTSADSGGENATADESSSLPTGDRARAMQERVADTVRDAAGEAKRQAESFYRDASVAAGKTSHAIDGAADALETSGHETLSQAAAALSDRVRTFSSYLENRRLEDLLGDARRLAQRNPGLFMAGGVALGFALSRFLKASADDPRGTRNLS
jgi:hypothetical protein